LGELAVGDALDETPDNIDPSPPTSWGKGYKGPRRESFPLPDEYALDENETPLDVTSAKILTTTFSSKRKHKPHPSIAAWNQRLPLSEDVDYNSIEIHQHTSHSSRLSSSLQTHQA
jgi:hypothetical protein